MIQCDRRRGSEHRAAASIGTPYIVALISLFAVGLLAVRRLKPA
jgi:hypothetical protein